MLSHQPTLSTDAGLLPLEMQLTLKLLVQTDYTLRELRTNNIVWLSQLINYQQKECLLSLHKFGGVRLKRQ